MSLSILGPDGQPFDRHLEIGHQVNSGKTKQVYRLPGGELALEHKGLITAFDDPSCTGVSGEKGITSAYSSALLFRRLGAAGIKTSHRGILNANTTIEMPLEMQPFELIWRRYNVIGNSWTKRHPGNKYTEGDRYDQIIYEACLKWSVEDLDAANENDKLVHDPFLVLDDEFRPLLRDDGMPRLTHSKTGKELRYAVVLHPNKGGVIAHDEVRGAIEGFTQNSTQIREMVTKVQEITFDTYAQIGRLNADGKIEVGGNMEIADIILGDELELDSLRNMALKKITINKETFTYQNDLLGGDLSEILGENPAKISRIIEAHHSGKQHYRDQVNDWRGQPFDSARIAANNTAAANTTNKIYIPVAQALSDKFGKAVGITLKSSAPNKSL